MSSPTSYLQRPIENKTQPLYFWIQIVMMLASLSAIVDAMFGGIRLTSFVGCAGPMIGFFAAGMLGQMRNKRQ